MKKYFLALSPESFREVGSKEVALGMSPKNEDLVYSGGELYRVRREGRKIILTPYMEGSI